MKASTLMLITVALLMAGAYVYWFTDYFHTPEIKILAQARPTTFGGRMANPNTVFPVSFAFNRKLLLTEVYVMAVDDEKTNKHPHAVWHMISDSNSVPTKSLIYGFPIRGMKPKIPRANPEPLEPDVPYRLHVIAEGDAKGQIVFQTKTSVPMQ